MAEKWVSQAELADICGFSVKTIQMIRKREPGVLTIRQNGNKDEFMLPDSIVGLLRREREIAARKERGRGKKDEKGKVLERKLEAETRMAELELEELLGDIIRLDEHERRFDEICGRIAAVLDVIPSKYLSRILLARNDVEAQEVGEAIREETKAALLGVSAESDDEDVEAAESALT